MHGVTHKKLLDDGLALMTKAKSIIDFPIDESPSFHTRLLSDYYLWIENIHNFLTSNLKNKVESSFFKETGKLPTLDYIKQYHLEGEYFITEPIAGDMITEIKNNLERLRNIAQKNPKLLTLKENKNTEAISVLEFLINDSGAYKVYINKDYNSEPLRFSKGPFWDNLYQLAEQQEVNFDKGFFDYFNSNSANPLYGDGRYAVTKMLIKDKHRITPGITIKLITQKKVTQNKNSA